MTDTDSTLITKPMVAKVVQLRVSVGNENDHMAMEEFIQHLKDVLLTHPTTPAKTVTAMHSEYIINGQRVRVEQYEAGKRTSVQTDPVEAKAEAAGPTAAQVEVQRLAKQVGKDMATEPTESEPKEQ